MVGIEIVKGTTIIDGIKFHSDTIGDSTIADLIPRTTKSIRSTRGDIALFGIENPFGGYEDSDSSSLLFQSQATPVPFEVDATLGLLLIGGISGIGYLKRKNQEKNISKVLV